MKDKSEYENSFFREGEWIKKYTFNTKDLHDKSGKFKYSESDGCFSLVFFCDDGVGYLVDSGEVMQNGS